MELLDDLIVISLASWRLASLLVQEDGPNDIFAKLRAAVMPEGEVSSLALVFTCVWCMSVWTAMVLTAVWVIWQLPVLVLAASALAIIVHEHLSK